MRPSSLQLYSVQPAKIQTAVSPDSPLLDFPLNSLFSQQMQCHALATSSSTVLPLRRYFQSKTQQGIHRLETKEIVASLRYVLVRLLPDKTMSYIDMRVAVVFSNNSPGVRSVPTASTTDPACTSVYTSVLNLAAVTTTIQMCQQTNHASMLVMLH